MRFTTRLSFALALSLVSARAEAAEFNLVWQEFHGSGIAQVYDGGPPDQDAVDIIGPTHLGGSFFAVDRTCNGSLCAHSRAVGESVTMLSADRLELYVELSVGYSPSFFPGGDNPGGMAQGGLSSIVEFTLPVDVVDWFYALRVDTSGFWTGSTRSLVTNLSTSELLLDLTQKQIPGVVTTLSATAGDVIRITTQMSGAVDIEPIPWAPSLYWSTLNMWFTVPEPTGTVVLLLGSLVLFGRTQMRRRGVR